MVKFLRIAEAIDGGGEIVVEIFPAFDFFEIGWVDGAGMLDCFEKHFGFELLVKTAAVKGQFGQVEPGGARREIDRGGNGDSGANTIGMSLGIDSQVLQGDIAAHATADEDDLLIVFGA